MPQSPLKFDQQAPGLRCAAVSDVGMRRSNNQDSLAISLAETGAVWRERGHLFVIADGMGAHAAGEMASEIATSNIPLAYHKARDREPAEALAAAMHDANSRIFRKGQDSVDFHGMGTTCSCLLLLPTGAVAAHVGDSRVYRLRGHLLEQLTFDHSLVWEMGAAGHASEEAVPAYVPRNVITRSLGPHPEVQVDLEGPFTIVPGDRYLLCSDGLTGPLSPELIGLVMASLSPLEAAQTLVDLANLLGGPDNISVIVAEASDLWRIDTRSDSVSLSDTVVMDEGADAWWRQPARRWYAGAVMALLAAVGLALSGGGWGVVAAVAIGFGLALVGLRAAGRGGDQLTIHAHEAPRGKAPYRRYKVDPNSQKIEVLSDIVRQIEDLEAQREWGFDWTTIHEDRGKALEAIGRGDFSVAVIAYCRAVRGLMQALRNSEGGVSDSTINLDDEG